MGADDIAAAGMPTHRGDVSLHALIERAAEAAPSPAAAQKRAFERLRELEKHLREGTLRVAVLGQFKRGKSSLLNSILGQQLLPTGVTPITAIPTFVRGSDTPRLRVDFDQPTQPLISFDADRFPQILSRYVSEEENPRNEAKVALVQIEAPTDPSLRHIVFVDTPGVGSTLIHNTRAAEAVLTDCDAGIFVVSADPPITAVELDYLDQTRRHLPKLLFVLNKVDRLDDHERTAAEGFLRKVLKEHLGDSDPPRIFAVSARRALAAKQRRDSRALIASGLAPLEHALSNELAQEKAAIVIATARARALALFSEVLFHSEFAHRALLTPTQELEAKISEFEESMARFKLEGENLSDLLSIDRRRLLSRINEMTDALWNDARARFRSMVGSGPGDRVEERHLRERIAREMASYFEAAFKSLTDKARQDLIDSLTAREANVSNLIGKVRDAAAGLLAITAAAPPPEDAFELSREPYWVAPAPSETITDSAALALVRLLPDVLRRKRLRVALLADTDRAVLRNVANLDWALRQNVEDAYRRFTNASSQQVIKAFEETLEAMRAAIRARTERSIAIEEAVKQSSQAVGALRDIVDSAPLISAA